MDSLFGLCMMENEHLDSSKMNQIFDIVRNNVIKGWFAILSYGGHN